MCETFSHLEPSRATRDEIWEFAEKISMGLEYSPEGTLVDAVIKLGGKMDTSNDGKTTITADSNKEFTLYVPSESAGPERKGDIAHELGHFLLHMRHAKTFPVSAQIGMPNMNESLTTDEKIKAFEREWEANEFASAFLMTKRGYEQYKKKLSQYEQEKLDLLSASIYFGIPVVAVEERISYFNTPREGEAA